MSIREKLSSLSERVGSAQVQRDQEIAQRVQGVERPVAIDIAAIYRTDNPLPPVVDTGIPIVRHFKPGERIPDELSDAQIEGANVAIGFAERSRVTNELAYLGGRS